MQHNSQKEIHKLHNKSQNDIHQVLPQNKCTTRVTYKSYKSREVSSIFFL